MKKILSQLFKHCFVLLKRKWLVLTLIGFQITGQADEQYHGDYSKISLVSKMIFKELFHNLKPKQRFLVHKI